MSDVLIPVYEVILAGGLGSFITAFCTELGKRFGGSVSDWASRVYLRVRRGREKRAANSTPEVVLDSEGKAVVAVDAEGNAIVAVEFPHPFTDEAKRALLELDVSSDAIRGRRLIWDAEAGTWGPAGSSGGFAIPG